MECTIEQDNRVFNYVVYFLIANVAYILFYAAKCVQDTTKQTSIQKKY
jgi:hypothetical protein